MQPHPILRASSGGGDGDLDQALLDRPISSQILWTSSPSLRVLCRVSFCGEVTVTSGGCKARASLPSGTPRLWKALPSSESAVTIRPLGSWISSTGWAGSPDAAGFGVFDLVDAALLEAPDL